MFIPARHELALRPSRPFPARHLPNTEHPSPVFLSRPNRLLTISKLKPGCLLLSLLGLASLTFSAGCQIPDKAADAQITERIRLTPVQSERYSKMKGV
jgi:hypothetical protein